MKAIIEIIKEEIEAGNKNINTAHYKNHTEQNLPLAGWTGEVPSIGDVLTNGTQDMKVVEYVVLDDEVGVKMDAGTVVTATQVVEMIENKICWVK
jgi:hypothetical protein